MHMKLLSTLIACCFFVTQALTQTPDTQLEALVCKEMHAHKQIADASGTPEFMDDQSFDLRYSRFVWAIDPNVKEISGTVTHHFEVKQNGLNTLQLNLAAQLVVDSIRFRGTHITFTESGAYGLTVQLPVTLSVGDRDSLSITYHGVPLTTGFGSFNKASHAGIPIIWTLSAPLGSQDWWPCKNGLTDKLDSIDIIITTPSQYRAAGIGTLVAEQVVGSKTTFHWKHRYPIAPYLVAFAVTNYVQYTDQVALKGGVQMPMLNYVYPESLTAAKTGTADLVQVLQFYDSLFVGYPFAQEKYGHAQFGWGGGMEHQTMSFVTDFSWSLLAHELAHQWFGDAVTCASWEDVWINEGSATYLEGLTQERFKSAATWLNWKKGKVSNITSSAAGSVRVDDTTSVNRIFSSRLTYNKGSYLLHMLRWKVGDAAFFAGVRTFLSDKQYGFAKTASFQAHLEQASGMNLTEYFQDWYVGQGYPKYQVEWSQSVDNQLNVRIGQTQSHSSVSFFEMPVPIRFVGAGRDTILRFEHTVSGQMFQANLPFVVTSVVFDPEVWLISAGNTITKGTVSAADSNGFDFGLQVQPNPVSALPSQVSIAAPSAGIALVSVQNLSGQSVFQSTQRVDYGANQFDLELANFPSGMYVLSVKLKEGVAITRLLKF
jgi:aminopeptidase N